MSRSIKVIKFLEMVLIEQHARRKNQLSLSMRNDDGKSVQLAISCAVAYYHAYSEGFSLALPRTRLLAACDYTAVKPTEMCAIVAGHGR